MGSVIRRRIVDRDIDLDKLRPTVRCGRKAHDFHGDTPKLGTPGPRGKRSQRPETVSLNDTVAVQGRHRRLVEAEPVF
jgi:hypothetical protein